jgi:hypothetical protein
MTICGPGAAPFGFELCVDTPLNLVKTISTITAYCDL